MKLITEYVDYINRREWILLSDEQVTAILDMIDCRYKNADRDGFSFKIFYFYFDDFCKYGEIYLKKKRFRSKKSREDSYNSYLLHNYLLVKPLSVKFVVSRDLRYIDVVIMHNTQSKDFYFPHDGSSTVLHLDRKARYSTFKNKFLFHALDVVVAGKKEPIALGGFL